jgi:nucleotide-binding universal stress UspA family protein
VGLSARGFAPLLEVQLKSILLATDFSPASEKALRYAVSLARHYSSKIYLVNVVSSLGLTMAGPDAIVEASRTAEREVADAKERLRRGGVLDGIAFEVLVREGDIWHELEKVVRHERIDLIVIGTHSRTGFAKVALGSVAERIFRNAHCPVLTIGANCASETRAQQTAPRILFPTDFGDKSLRPLPYALWLARQLRARLVVFHALSKVFAPTDMMRHNVENGIDMHAEVKLACIERLRSLIPATYLEREPIYEAEFGDPAEMILQAASRHGAEAITMGLTHIRHADALAHAPWSMTYKVVCGAQCPVLTVRGEVH